MGKSLPRGLEATLPMQGHTGFSSRNPTGRTLYDATGGQATRKSCGQRAGGSAFDLASHLPFPRVQRLCPAGISCSRLVPLSSAVSSALLRHPPHGRLYRPMARVHVSPTRGGLPVMLLSPREPPYTSRPSAPSLCGAISPCRAAPDISPVHGWGGAPGALHCR